MSTYAENQAARERVGWKAGQDHFLARQTAEFDLAAQDVRMKYERPSFVVVTASRAFREGWEQIFGDKATAQAPVEDGRLQEAGPASRGPAE